MVMSNRGTGSNVPCACCKTVNTLCFWGPMPEKPWKRPALFVFSLLGAVGFGILLWHAWTATAGVLYFILTGLLVALSLLGILVSLRGCNACVARLFGSA